MEEGYQHCCVPGGEGHPPVRDSHHIVHFSQKNRLLLLHSQNDYPLQHSLLSQGQDQCEVLRQRIVSDEHHARHGDRIRRDNALPAAGHRHLHLNHAGAGHWEQQALPEQPFQHARVPNLPVFKGCESNRLSFVRWLWVSECGWWGLWWIGGIGCLRIRRSSFLRWRTICSTLFRPSIMCCCFQRVME